MLQTRKHTCNPGRLTRSAFCLLIALLLTVTVGARQIRAADTKYAIYFGNSSLTMDIGDTCYIMTPTEYLLAPAAYRFCHLCYITTSSKTPTFKSSKSSVAGISQDDGYYIIEAKKAGTATITGKVTGDQDTCKITVNKTVITLSKVKLTLTVGDTLRLNAVTSNGSDVTWKCSKSSVLDLDDTVSVSAGCDGTAALEALKAGTATITATADSSKATCKVTVKAPEVRISKTKASLYRTNTLQLNATSSNRHTITWSSNKTSVATVDEKGLVTAVKHGTATITAACDGTKKTCTITVKQPKLSLSAYSLTLTEGSSARLKASVSSGVPVTWTSSNPAIARVAGCSNNVKINAFSAGSCTIKASEDGVSLSCKVKVTSSDS